MFDFLGSKKNDQSGSPSQDAQGTTTSSTVTTVTTDQSSVQSAQSGTMYNGVGSAPAGAVTTDGITPPQAPKAAQPSGQTQTAGIPTAAANTQQPATPMDKKTGMDIMTRLTQRSNRVLLVAAQKAQALNNPLVDSEHVLYGLLADQEIFNLLSQLKLIPQEVVKQLEATFHKGTTPTKPQLAPRVKKILEDALIVARKLGYEFISPEHILYALYHEGEGVGSRILVKVGLNKDELNIKVLGKKKGLETQQQEERKQSALEKYTTDLTAKAAAGQLDPVVERSQVIERVIHILSRRSKNNPVLTGEAGVGKTAIVEGLAEKIVSKEVPETLLNHRVLQLDLMAILAGASHRGEFEERLKGVMDELKAMMGKVILFIDEIHNIVGAGGEAGSGDAANIIKPALARGEVQLIGATTTSEYRKYIEKDPALERRFQPIEVPEPSEDAAIKMLRAIRDKYEAFHKVKIPDEAIEAAVKLSKRYVGGRFLPDKAIDLIDETASAVRLPIISLPEEIKSQEEKIKAMQQERMEALKINNKVKANIYEKKIIDAQDLLKQKQEEYLQKKAMSVGVVNLQMIKDVIARWTGIPVNKITESEKDKISNLEDIMHKRLINQKVAVAAVAQAIRRGRAGLKSTQRPIGSFIFLGPTGVGKTELVKTLAEVLFGTEDSMVRFDMTEYMEKHEVAKLLGAPPGYVGYEEGGKLTEAVKRKPYSVVLFDEVEKAHPDIFNILLQILDDGRLTDNKGHTISFKNTVVICTSNIGSRTIQQELMKSGKDQIEEPLALNTYVVSPRGRAIVTVGNTVFLKEAETNTWAESILRDYFAGQKILTIDENGKDKEVDFSLFKIQTHAISPQGSEYITAEENLYVRTATTAKEWRLMKLLDYAKDAVVVNGLPDTPEEQLPTIKFHTHAFTSQEEEIVTYKNRMWKRKTGTNDWQTQTLSEYLNGAKTSDNKPLPVAYWNIHLFNSKGEELIVVGEMVYHRSGTVWEAKPVVEFFGEGFPLQAEIKRMQEVQEEVDKQKFGKIKDRVMDELMKFMRPELVNRFDEVVVFEPLRYEHMLLIVKLQIKGLRTLLEEQSFGLEVTEAAQKEIVRVGFDPVFGARPLRRALQKLVENPISELIIAQKVKEGEAILVDYDGENFTFTMAQAELNPQQEEKKESFTCQYCQYKFETIVRKGKSTVVCSKCGKGQKEKKDDNKQQASDKKEDEKKTEPAISMTLPPTADINGKAAQNNFQPQLATL